MAARASLAYLGQEEIYLTGEPEVTYFIEKYKGPSQFASRVDEVQFNVDSVLFGSETYVDLPRSGDIITKIYLKMSLPTDALGTSSVLNSAGTLMLQYAELYIGSTIVERLWGEFIEMKYDLEIPETKQAALAAMTGKGTTSLLTTYTIPLPFSIIKKGFPWCAVKENLQFRMTLHPSTMFTNPPIVVSKPVNASLHVEYTYISEPELNFIKNKPQIQLIEQVQKLEFFSPKGVNFVRCPLSFVNTVKELFFVIQNDSARGYDYSTTSGTSTDQLKNLVLYFNTTDRIASDVGTPVFLRNIQAIEFHTRIPDGLFYMYSFSIDPEGDAPCGHVNFSRINNQTLEINMNTSASNRYISVYAVSYNFIDIQPDGSARILFNNFES